MQSAKNVGFDSSAGSTFLANPLESGFNSLIQQKKDSVTVTRTEFYEKVWMVTIAKEKLVDASWPDCGCSNRFRLQ